MSAYLDGRFPWTDEQVAQLTALWPTHTPEKLAAILGCNKARRLGLPSKAHRPFNRSAWAEPQNYKPTATVKPYCPGRDPRPNLPNLPHKTVA